MITPEMFQVFNWSESQRRLHYGNLKKACHKMADLIGILVPAQRADGFIDLGVANKRDTFWIAITRPGMPDGRPDFPRRDLDLIEYLIEWAIGVERHAANEIFEMDQQYPELRKLSLSELLPAQRTSAARAVWNWLKMAFKAIFRSSRS